MNSIKIVTLSFLILCFNVSGIAQALEQGVEQGEYKYKSPIVNFIIGYKNPPNHLVENQLSPDVYKIENSFGIKSGLLTNNDIEVGEFNHNILSISASPFAPIDRKHQQLFLGFGFVQDKYSNVSNDFLNDSLGPFQIFQINGFFNTRIAKRFYWFSYLQLGLNGTHPFKTVEQSFNLMTSQKINWKINEHTNAGLGVVYISNLGSTLILPTIAFVHSTNHFIFNLDFPIKAEVEGMFHHRQIRPYAGVSFPAATWYNKNMDINVNHVGTDAYLGLKYMLVSFVSIYGSVQSSLGDTYKFEPRDNMHESGTFSNDLRFTIGISLQFAKFNPYIDR